MYCGGYWSLRLDNSHRDYVIVYLGDLGKLSHKEQLYWKSFNVVPDGGVSEVAFRRGILGQWADTDEPALAFKATYERFREAWREKFGWDLFKPLNPEDEHYWGTLHVPTSENQKEFDDQVMALAKLLIERLNEREIAKHITVEQNDKGITKFEKYLDTIGFPDRQQFITLLRNLFERESARRTRRWPQHRTPASGLRLAEPGPGGRGPGARPASVGPTCLFGVVPGGH